MKRKLFTILFALIAVFSLTSCITTAEAQTGVVPDVEMAITYGTPYIVNDMIEYYLYKNLYYYPFYINGSWYYRVYSRPLVTYPRHWRPAPRHYRFHNNRFIRRHDSSTRYSRPQINRPQINRPQHRGIQHNGRFSGRRK